MESSCCYCDFINSFAPEPPVTARADPGPFYPLWRHQFFKPYQNEHNSVKDTGERSKKPRDIDLKISGAKYEKKYSRKGKSNEKKFMHAN